MRFRTPLFRGSLLVAAFVMGAGTSCAFAQELQYLDSSKGQEAAPAAPAASAKKSRKSKKTEAPADAAAPQAAGKTGGQAGRPDRQFGELEGWSPGKTPPKPKDKYSSDNDGSSSAGSMPVKVGPSGNIGSGFSF